jgi:hypothetical protein
MPVTRHNAFPEGTLKIVPGPEYESGVTKEPMNISPVSAVSGGIDPALYEEPYAN